MASRSVPARASAAADQAQHLFLRRPSSASGGFLSEAKPRPAPFNDAVVVTAGTGEALLLLFLFPLSFSLFVEASPPLRSKTPARPLQRRRRCHIRDGRGSSSSLPLSSLFLSLRRGISSPKQKPRPAPFNDAGVVTSGTGEDGRGSFSSLPLSSLFPSLRRGISASPKQNPGPPPSTTSSLSHQGRGRTGEALLPLFLLPLSFSLFVEVSPPLRSKIPARPFDDAVVVTSGTVEALLPLFLFPLSFSLFVRRSISTSYAAPLANDPHLSGDNCSGGGLGSSSYLSLHLSLLLSHALSLSPANLRRRSTSWVSNLHLFVPGRLVSGTRRLAMTTKLHRRAGGDFGFYGNKDGGGGEEERRERGSSCRQC